MKERIMLLRVIATMDSNSGGPCQGVRNSISKLEELGIQNEVLCLDAPASGFSAKDPFPTYCLDGRKGAWAYNPNLLPWLLSNLHQYDAVIIHGIWLYPGYAVNKAINILKKRVKIGQNLRIPKVYVMPHGMLDPYFQKAASRRVKAARNWLFWKLVERKVVNKADGVLFTCQSELELARLPFKPYKPKQELNVGYGIMQPPPFTKRMHKVFEALIPGGLPAPYFLFLARLHEKKGVDILVDAYATLDMKYPHLPQLVIAGPGLDTPYGKFLLQKVAKLNLKNKVVFAGMLTGEAKWGAFYGCEAYILPSHQENFGISVVEALACGKPVLISNQVNIWQEIKACGAGIIGDDTKAGTIHLMESWMQLSQSQKAEMGENAEACFHKHFAIEQYAYNISKLLKRPSISVDTISSYQHG